MSSIATHASRMKEILGLETEPVAVFLLPPGPVPPVLDSFAPVAAHRYCQLLMRARRGESLSLEPAELACPAVLQATCVDATIIPHVEQRLNFSLGCYRCREATDLGANETVLGFPGALLSELVLALERLNEKAVARSRAKAALGHLQAKKEKT